MFGKKKEKKDTVSQYVDTTGELPSRELVRGIWFVKHKLLFRKIVIWMLFAWCGVTVMLSIILWGKYVVVDVWKDRDLAVRHVAEVPDYAAAHAIYAAAPLSLSSVDVYRSAQDLYDFVVFVENPNKQFFGRLTYHLTYTGGQTSAKTRVIMPGVKQPIALLGHESDTFPSNVVFSIDDLSWERVSPHEVADPMLFLSERVNFSASNLVFERAGEAGVTLPRVRFDLTNHSLYSFWQADFYVELLRGGSRVGLLFVSVDQFLAGETRPVDARPAFDLSGVSSMTLYPLVNAFDKDAYMPVELSLEQ